jgi:hypothetical protein
MEDDNLEMGLFDNLDNLELNSSYQFDEDLIENEETESVETDENINTIDDENQEGVDSEEDVDEEGGNEGGESSSNLYSSLANFVHEQGLLPSLDIKNTEIKTPNDFANAFKQELEIQADLKLEEYLKNVDVKSIVESRNLIENFETISEDVLKSDLELSKQIILQDYLNQGLDEKKANRLLNRLIDLGEDAILEDAAESLASLKEFETRKIATEKETLKIRTQQKIEEQKQAEENLKKTIYESKDLVNGLKVNKVLQDKVYKSITEIVGKSPEGEFENKFMKERRLNPIDFETRMYYFYEMTDGFKDFTKLTTPIKSNAVKELEQIARKSKIQDNGIPIWMQDNESYEGFKPGSVLNI